MPLLLCLFHQAAQFGTFGSDLVCYEAGYVLHFFQHLFDRLYDHWKSGNRIQTLMILGHLVRREPLWLGKIVSHPLLQSIVKVLKVGAAVLFLCF